MPNCSICIHIGDGMNISSGCGFHIRYGPPHAAPHILSLVPPLIISSVGWCDHDFTRALLVWLSLVCFIDKSEFIHCTGHSKKC
jgi:hypothetical protein